jgi:hypothetical protein
MPGPHVKYEDAKPGTATGVNMPGPHIQYGTIGTRPGNGGSGGKRSAN